MTDTKRLALTVAACLLATSAFADKHEQTRDQLRAAGCGGEITETDSEKGHEFRCQLGDGGEAHVVVDPDTGEVIEQGKYRNGERVGEDVIPEKHHKDDGVKYGDQTQTGNDDKGAEHSNDDGVGGGDHSHEKSQTGKN